MNARVGGRLLCGTNSSNSAIVMSVAHSRLLWLLFRLLLLSLLLLLLQAGVFSASFNIRSSAVSICLLSICVNQPPSTPPGIQIQKQTHHGTHTSEQLQIQIYAVNSFNFFLLHRYVRRNVYRYVAAFVVGLTKKWTKKRKRSRIRKNIYCTLGC